MLRWSRWIIRTILGLSATVLVLSAALVWRVSREPLSLDFLVPYLQESLSLTDLNVRVGLEDVVLAWSDAEQALRLRVVNATFSGERDLTLKVPEIDLALSGASLLRGVIAPTYLRIGGVEALLLRDPEGRFRLGAPEAEQAATDTVGKADDFATALFAGMFDRLSKPVDLHDPLGQVNSISVEIARLVILDQKLGQRWEAPGTIFQADRGEGSVRASLVGSLAWRNKQLRMALTAEYVAAERAAEANLRFEGVEPADFADLASDLKPLGGMHMPLSGQMAFRVAQSGDIADLRFTLAAGAGHITMPDLWLQPLSLREAQMRGRFEASNTPGIGDTLVIESASAAFADRLAITLSGQLRRPMPDELGLEIKGRFTDLPVDALAHYWPIGMAKNARDWIMAHIRGGMVPEAEFNAQVSPAMLAGKQKLPRDAVRLAFRFEGLGVDYFPPLTRLTEAKGAAVLDADEFNLTVASGRVGSLQASAGKLRVDGLQARDQFADIAITAAGANKDLLGLIDQKPLGYATLLGIKPASVEGTGRVDTTFRLPLDHKLKLDDVKFLAKASLLNLAIPDVYDRFALTDGTVQMTVDPKGLDAEGTAALSGVPVRLGWRQEFDNKQPVTARYKLSGRADNAGRKALGFDLDPFIDGPLDAVAEIESRRQGNETTIRTQLDLTPAKMAIPDIFWTKPVGKPGQANFTARLRPGQPTQFEGLRITADRFIADGNAALAPDNSWSLHLGLLKVGDSEANVELRRATNGDMTIRAEGKRYDLIEFVKASDAETGEPAPQPKLDLRLRFDEALLDEKTSLRNFALDMERGRLVTEKLELSGAFNSGGTVALRIAPNPDAAKKQRLFTVRSDNAGAVFSYLGIENMQGGVLEVDGRYEDGKPGQPLEATLTARQFKAVQAPFLARLLGIGSFTGLAALLSGEGINFDSATVPFTQKEGVLTIQPSRIRGPQLGITLEGTVNRKTNHVNVIGTAVPAFVLNTLLGRIPVLGDLFIGDGIIGVNFAVTGPREKTDMSVNPLSAIAPGFLRRIFQAGSNDTPADPNAPPVPPQEFRTAPSNPQ
jgi:uncharacterized protein YhdP